MKIKKIIAILCLASYFTAYIHDAAQAGGFIEGRSGEKLSSYGEYAAGNQYISIDSSKRHVAVSRIELARIMNSIYAFESKGDIGFKDIEGDSECGEEAEKAAAAGYMLGYADKTFRPENKIKRQEVAMVVYRLMKLENMPEYRKGKPCRDLRHNPPWSKTAIEAVVNAGYMTTEQGCFYPEKTFTWGEAEGLVNMLSGTLLYKADTYGQEEGILEIEGNVTIGAGGVVLQDTVVKGDLYIAPKAGKGRIDLQNVKVMGRTIVCGGSELTLSEASKIQGVIIDKKSQDFLELTAKNDSRAGDITIKSHASLREEAVTGLAFGDIYIDKAMKEKGIVELKGDFTAITTEAADVVISIKEGSMVGTLTLNAKTKVSGGGIIGTINLNARDCEIAQTPGRMNLGLGIKSH